MKCFSWSFINSYTICTKCGGWLGEYIKTALSLYMHPCILTRGVIYISVTVGHLLITRFLWRSGKSVRVTETPSATSSPWKKKISEKVPSEAIICPHNHFRWKFAMLRGKFSKHFHFLFLKSACSASNHMHHWCLPGRKFCICFTICNKKCIFGGNVAPFEMIANGSLSDCANL